MPAGIDRSLIAADETGVNWRDAPRISSVTTLADYSWMRPNRQHIWADFSTNW
jgi:hypothetical protein